MLTAMFQKGWWGTGPSHFPHPMLRPEQCSAVSFPWEWGRALAGSREFGVLILNPLIWSRWPCIAYFTCVCSCFHDLKNRNKRSTSKQGGGSMRSCLDQGIKDLHCRAARFNSKSLLSTWWKRVSIVQPEKLTGLSWAPSTEFPLLHRPWRVKERVHVSNSPGRVLKSIKHSKMEAVIAVLIRGRLNAILIWQQAGWERQADFQTDTNFYQHQTVSKAWVPSDQEWK